MSIKGLFASQTNLWSASQSNIWKIESDYTITQLSEDVTDVPIYFAQCAVPTGAFTPSYSTAGTTTFTVPANVNSITITAVGAGGGGGGAASGAIIPNPNPNTNVSSGGGGGGAGGYATDTFAVSPGDVLEIFIASGTTGGAGGYPSGADGDNPAPGSETTVTNLSTATLLLSASCGDPGLGGGCTAATYTSEGLGGAGGVPVVGTGGDGGTGGTGEIVAVNKFGVGGGTGSWWRASTAGADGTGDSAGSGGASTNSLSAGVGGGGGGSYGGFGGVGASGTGQDGTFGAGGSGGGGILGTSTASAGGNGGDGAVYLSYSTSSAYTPEGIIFLHNRTNAWTIANGSTTLTPVLQQPDAGAGFPQGPLACGTIYLDGYIFVMDESGRIYNSGIEDPTTWGALDYITAGSDPDYGVAIAKQLNYIVAFNTYSTQFFYNAGNAEGSPLGANISANINIGCVNGDSVATFENTTIWVGQSRTYGKAVYQLEGISPKRISTRNIEKILEKTDWLSEVYSTALKFRGHTYYILTLVNQDADEDSLTLVYDLEQQIWVKWDSNLSDYVEDNPGYFMGAYFANFDNVPMVGSLIDNKIYEIVVSGIDTFSDTESAPIICSGETEIYDSGSTKRKFYRRLEVIGDRPASVMTLEISHFKDDYSVESNPRVVDLFATNARPQLVALGSDRRRAWKWTTTNDYGATIRLEALEVDFDLGGLSNEQG